MRDLTVLEQVLEIVMSFKGRLLPICCFNLDNRIDGKPLESLTEYYQIEQTEDFVLRLVSVKDKRTIIIEKLGGSLQVLGHDIDGEPHKTIDNENIAEELPAFLLEMLSIDTPKSGECFLLFDGDEFAVWNGEPISSGDSMVDLLNELSLVAPDLILLAKSKDDVVKSMVNGTVGVLRDMLAKMMVDDKDFLAIVIEAMAFATADGLRPKELRRYNTVENPDEQTTK